ncbi:MAG: hypothetical protein JWQ00_2460, partial [Noviherbaspirillum sp.]|nr:hypothetical protein [Noviherbaspirillum sp.]
PMGIIRDPAKNTVVEFEVAAEVLGVPRPK